MNKKYVVKIQQLERYIFQLTKLVNTGRFKSLAAKKRNQIISRIERLQAQLAFLANSSRVKRVLVAASFTLGVAIAPAAAQSFQFKPAQASAFGLGTGYYYSFVTSQDIDGDGDFDVLINEYYGNFQYFENTGTAAAPAFAAPVMNPFGLTTDSINYVSFPEFADIDGDGDFDIISGTAYSGSILYYENTGTATAPVFGTPTTGTFGLTTSGYQYAIPTAADLDGDGDLDILYTEYYGAIYYQENTGTATAPAFAAPVASPFGLVPATIGFGFPRLADVDGDGDYDLFYGSEDYGIYFHENTGTATAPVFGAAQLAPFGLDNTTNLNSIAFADMDNDGDLDALIGGYGYYGGTLVYQENNQAPTSAAGMVTTTKNVDYTFANTDFSFTDADDAALVSVNIVSLPAKGTLKLSGNAVTAGDNILAADLGNLVFAPVADSLGVPYTTFEFEVMDDIMPCANVQTMTIDVQAPVGVSKLMDNASIRLAPNPATDWLRIEITGVEAVSQATLLIRDMSGRLVRQEVLTGAELNNKTISTADLATGVYFMSIETTKGILRERFVKQ